VALSAHYPLLPIIEEKISPNIFEDSRKRSVENTGIVTRLIYLFSLGRSLKFLNAVFY